METSWWAHHLEEIPQPWCQTSAWGARSGSLGGGWAIHPTHILTLPQMPPPNPWESCPDAFLRPPAAHTAGSTGAAQAKEGWQKTLSRTALRFPQSLKSCCFAAWPLLGKCVFLQRLLARKSPLACWVPGGRCRNTKAARTPGPKPVTAFSLLHSWEGNWLELPIANFKILRHKNHKSKMDSIH